MADDDARMNKKAVRLLFGGVLVAGLVGSLLGGLLGPGDEDAAACPPCWPNWLCPVDNNNTTAYQVLQMIREQANGDLTAGKITPATYNNVAKALIQCASDINPFSKGGQSGNAAHCEWLESVWDKAKLAEDDAAWAGPGSVAADLEAGH